MTRATDGVLLVGELNPFGGDPGYALWPDPAHCSGGRLMRILGMRRYDYVRTERVNLCRGRWALRAARAAAEECEQRAGIHTLVLLGRKVATAFGYGEMPLFQTLHRDLPDNRRLRFVILPHPSGLNRTWRSPDSLHRARELLQDVLPVNKSGCRCCEDNLPPGCPYDQSSSTMIKQYTCPKCRKKYEHVCDEAEGCRWDEVAG